MFCKKRCSERFRKFHRKTPVLVSLFNKVADVQACNFNKKRLQHRCFPVKFVEFLRTLTLKNICERLLLAAKYILQSYTEMQPRYLNLTTQYKNNLFLDVFETFVNYADFTDIAPQPYITNASVF